MSTQEKIKEEMKLALKNNDKIRLETLRSLQAALVNELVAQKRKPDEAVEDDLALKVLKRALKQRLESAEQFKAGSRMDLAEKEEKEAEIIKEFLPQMLSEEEIKTIVQDCINEIGEASKKDFGKIISCTIDRSQGRAEGKDIKAVVDSMLE